MNKQDITKALSEIDIAVSFVPYCSGGTYVHVRRKTSNYPVSIGSIEDVSAMNETELLELAQHRLKRGGRPRRNADRGQHEVKMNNNVDDPIARISEHYEQLCIYTNDVDEVKDKKYIFVLNVAPLANYLAWRNKTVKEALPENKGEELMGQLRKSNSRLVDLHYMVEYGIDVRKHVYKSAKEAQEAICPVVSPVTGYRFRSKKPKKVDVID